jgi:hypothetical protein
VKPRNLCPYFQGSINSVLALHRPNPFNPRPLRLPNLHPPNLQPFKLRRREPAPKSERHAHRPVLFPTVPIWALGTSGEHGLAGLVGCNWKGGEPFLEDCAVRNRGHGTARWLCSAFFAYDLSTFAGSPGLCVVAQRKLNYPGP